MPRRTPRSVLYLLCVPLVLGSLSACDNAEHRLDTIVAAAQPGTRTQVANELVAAFDANSITFEASLIRAETMLAESHPMATVFAGAVLDFAARIDDVLPSGAEHELFWRRIGQLSYQASFEAMNAHRWDEASTLVLAGPRRWQRDAYWLAYPNHDILVAVSLGQQGEPRRGIARLQSRPIETSEMQAAIAQLRELDRQQLRDRLRERVEAETTTGG